MSGPAATTDVPDLGPVPTRIAVDEATVASLIAAQFPRWSGLPIRRVAAEGWDNQTFHLGEELLVRLPSAAEYALAVAKEHRWLPVLAPRLPLPIPEPLGRGEPGQGYPHPWSVYRWLPGESASREKIADPTGFATALAGFLGALRSVDPTDGPGPGRHNWYRGGTLLTFAARLEEDLVTLGDRVPRRRLRAAWRAALDATWDGVPVWFHGDVAVGNLLIRGGELAAVIDFGTCGVGDPACDLAIAWTLFAGSDRAAFRAGLAVDDGSWARGRGWALWKALAQLAGCHRDGDPEPAEARRVVEEIAADPELD